MAATRESPILGTTTSPPELQINPQLNSCSSRKSRSRVSSASVRRERPDKSDSLSFPSGHAAGGFAVATVLARHYGWKGAIPGYAGAAYIAAARVHDNKHYLSDVTFGAAMGIAGSRTVLRTGRYGVRVSPALAPGQIGLSVTLVPPLQRTTTAFTR